MIFLNYLVYWLICVIFLSKLVYWYYCLWHLFGKLGFISISVNILWWYNWIGVYIFQIINIIFNGIICHNLLVCITQMSIIAIILSWANIGVRMFIKCGSCLSSLILSDHEVWLWERWLWLMLGRLLLGIMTWLMMFKFWN